MIESRTFSLKPGIRYPNGAVPDKGGVNFSIFSRYANYVELSLYDKADSPDPFQVIILDPEINKTFFSWHVYVENLPVGTSYTWRMDGPNDTSITGHRFDKGKHLLDPWARAVDDTLWNRHDAIKKGNNGHHSMRNIVVDVDYDWEGDTPLCLPSENTIIYELHVKGFTHHKTSNVKNPGTFTGLIEKIPYLQKLGITHVELLPIMAFDEQDVPASTANLGLHNYWGYSTHSFFSPHPGYCVSPKNGTHLKEFCDLVKALHKAGIGVIMDVVFNHTAEGDNEGPLINFKGMANSIFYHLESEDKRLYRDYTGCGNTVNCNHPIVTMYIISCLEYWVREMHVDGFRFDLASALARGEDGNPVYNAPVLWGIELSDRLAQTRLIAEAWDAAGLYQVGSFPGYRWSEWNGLYRDVLRSFLRGDKGLISELATRLSGSSDLYQSQGRLPINSINYITSHDGFTLYDQFSYQKKHNHNNGENNLDGHNDNRSINCGMEGATQDHQILTLRKQMAKNSITILMMSQGIPMLLAGDEVLRTQHGNNNCYCQDNEISWFDWTLTETNHDMLHFVQQIIALRKRHPSLLRRRFLNGNQTDKSTQPDIVWHGAAIEDPQWDDPSAQILAFTLRARGDNEQDLRVMINNSDNKKEMEIEKVDNKTWYLAVDTSRTYPDDIVIPGEQIAISESFCVVQAKSVVILENYIPIL